MTNKNDELIIQLKKQVAEKKATLKKSARFSPQTNCSLELDGNRYNIQVLTKEQLILLKVNLNIYRMSAQDLGILDEFKIAGFIINDWMTDVQSRIDILNRKQDEAKLRTMEERLETLLSAEKKVELELEDIKNMLK